MSDLSIGQLARSAGVAASAVRFYERRGLIKSDGRSEGNYRLYSARSVERLRFIRSTQAIGFSLNDVRALLEIAYSEESPCDDVLTLARNRLAEIREKIKDLRAVEKKLAKSLDECCLGTSGDICGKVGRLRGKACSCGTCAAPKKKVAAGA